MNAADKQRALQELKIPEEIYDELVKEALQQLRDTLPLIKESIQKQDFGTVAAYAHSLKGAGGNLRLTGIYHAALALEQEAKGSRDPDKINTHVMRLESEQ